jgi:hypothetical protein
MSGGSSLRISPSLFLLLHLRSVLLIIPFERISPCFHLSYRGIFLRLHLPPHIPLLPIALFRFFFFFFSCRSIDCMTKAYENGTVWEAWALFRLTARKPVLRFEDHLLFIIIYLFIIIAFFFFFFCAFRKYSTLRGKTRHVFLCEETIV